MSSATRVPDGVETLISAIRVLNVRRFFDQNVCVAVLGLGKSVWSFFGSNNLIQKDTRRLAIHAVRWPG